MARHRKLTTAVRAAIYDAFAAKESIEAVPADIRIDGRLCLVTGANSGLGRAVAIDLAKRGGRLLLACRSGHSCAVRDIGKAAGSTHVEMLDVDLADLGSVHRLCDELRERRVRLDIAVLDAGLMPRVATRSRQGYGVMFAVHFLANRVMVDRWLRDGVVQGDVSVGDEVGPAEVPRIIVVTSETHRSSDAIDFDGFGDFVPYGMRDGLKHYGLSKLHSCTFARELDRRLNPEGDLRVAVHALCPGPIASNIARDAPVAVKALLLPLMKMFFSSPSRAARPVTYLCCAKEPGSRSGIYLHMMHEKNPAALALDAGCGAQLCDASAKLLARHAPGATPPEVLDADE